MGIVLVALLTPVAVGPVGADHENQSITGVTVDAPNQLDYGETGDFYVNVTYENGATVSTSYYQIDQNVTGELSFDKDAHEVTADGDGGTDVKVTVTVDNIRKTVNVTRPRVNASENRTYTFDHDQIDPTITFIGNTTRQQVNDSFVYDFSSLQYGSNNVTTENGELVLETIPAEYTYIDGFEDGDISEYSGDTGDYRVISSGINGSTLDYQSSGGAYNEIVDTSTTQSLGENYTVEMEHGEKDARMDWRLWRESGRNGGLKVLSIETRDGNVGSGNMDLIAPSGTVTVDESTYLDTTLTVYVNTSTDGTVDQKVVASDGTTLATFNYDVDNYAVDTTTGGVAFSGSDNNDAGKLWWDDYRRLESKAVTKSSGYAVVEFTSSTTWDDARLNWTETETGGTVQHYVALDSDDDRNVADETYTEWSDTEEDTYKDIPNGTNVYVKTVLNHSSGDGPSVDRIGAAVGNSSVPTQTEDPKVTITNATVECEISYSGSLSDGATVNVTGGTCIDDSLNDGPNEFNVTTNASVVDWQYTGNRYDTTTKTHTTNITVLAAGVVSVDLLTTSQVFANESYDLIVEATYENGTTLDKTDSATLNSENSTIIGIYESNDTVVAQDAIWQNNLSGSLLLNATVDGVTDNHKTYYAPSDKIKYWDGLRPNVQQTTFISDGGFISLTAALIIGSFAGRLFVRKEQVTSVFANAAIAVTLTALMSALGIISMESFFLGVFVAGGVIILNHKFTGDITLVK
jgi:hypothetical protein